MSQFNEGEQAREERKKYQKTAQVLTLFILSYIAQWWAWIVFCLWSFFGEASAIIVRNFWSIKFTEEPTFDNLVKFTCNVCFLLFSGKFNGSV